jgi:hypothetical protein
MLNLNAKKEIKWAKILKSKIRLQISKQCINSLRRRTCDNNIINIDQNINSNATFVIYEEGDVGLGRSKSHRLQFITETRVSCTRSLFETIEGLIQLTMEVGLRRILKSRRLFHVNIFLENTMQERVLDILLVKTPTLRHSNG